MIDLQARTPPLGADVQRTKPDGRPTEYLLDQENDERAWFDDQVVDLQTQVTTVLAVADDAQARVTLEETARAEGDAALAASILEVEADNGLGTANGQVALVAEAGPSGYTAQYSWKLTAGNVSTGMRAMAKNDGTSAIAFDASQFLLTDPSYMGGALGNVFAYSGGYFRFGVPVIFGTPQLEYNSVNTIQSTALAAQADYPSTSTGPWIDVLTLSVTGGTGAYAFATYQISGALGSGGTVDLQIRVISDASGVVIPNYPGFVPSGATGFDFSVPGTTTFRLQISNRTTGGVGRLASIYAGTRLTVEVRFR